MTSSTARHAALALLATGCLLSSPAPASPAPNGEEAKPQATAGRFELAALPDAPFWETEDEPEQAILAIPSFIAPHLDKSVAFGERARRNGLARAELEAATIRRGFTAPTDRPYAATERAVGVRLGQNPLSLETSLVSGTGTWEGKDTRLNWALRRRGGAESNGLRWGWGTGGGVGMSGSTSQNASASLGYSHSLFDMVTLTSEIALASSYAFASHAQPDASLTPQVQIVTDLSSTLSTPWKTVLDVKLNRQLPLTGGDPQSNASAMLRLQFRP
ncbi:hypothetical protein ABE438_01000 [Bosea sp. TWI1241]|uniref:hypothetical protein n=1 Tax=Bosea sp. TWI1241 TaxID=3148904 RepID=UPI003208B8B2